MSNDRIKHLEKCLEQALHSRREDEGMLYKALEALEFATYHDGRYGQVESEEFQQKAIEIEKLICTRLSLKRYSTLKKDAPRD